MATRGGPGRGGQQGPAATRHMGQGADRQRSKSDQLAAAGIGHPSTSSSVNHCTRPGASHHVAAVVHDDHLLKDLLRCSSEAQHWRPDSANLPPPPPPLLRPQDPGLLQSPLGADYLALVLRQLLPTPEYTRLLQPQVANSE